MLIVSPFPVSRFEFRVEILLLLPFYCKCFLDCRCIRFTICHLRFTVLTSSPAPPSRVRSARPSCCRDRFLFKGLFHALGFQEPAEPACGLLTYAVLII